MAEVRPVRTESDYAAALAYANNRSCCRQLPPLMLSRLVRSSYNSRSWVTRFRSIRLSPSRSAA